MTNMTFKERWGRGEYDNVTDWTIATAESAPYLHLNCLDDFFAFWRSRMPRSKLITRCRKLIENSKNQGNNR